MKKFLLYGITILGFFTNTSSAHFPVFISDSPFVPVGGELNVGIDLFFVSAHPFEQEYTPTNMPEQVIAVKPDGTREDITGNLTRDVFVVDGQENEVWSLRFTPDTRGDTILAVDSNPEIGFNNSLHQEYIKLVVHTEESGGWDNRTGQPLEIVPLTRPYGLEEGFVFTGQLLMGDEPVPNAVVQIEEFLERIPNPELLPPEPFITREVKTDPNGVFTHTLPRAAWWIFAVEVEDAGEVVRNGVTYNLNALAAFWLKVDKPVEIQFGIPSGIRNWNDPTP